MNFWRSPKFKVLHLEWDRRLKEEGLKDKLDSIASTTYGKASELERETRREYYLIVERKIEHAKFSCPLHKVIMFLHSQGFNAREITFRINELGYQECYRTVGFIVRRYQKLWGLKNWSSSQMNLTNSQNLKKVLTK